MEKVQFHPDIVNLAVGCLVGIIVGMFIGYIIWSRHKGDAAILGELKWSQLIASAFVMVCLIIGASDAITISLVALIPAEAVMIGIAKKVEKGSSNEQK